MDAHGIRTVAQGGSNQRKGKLTITAAALLVLLHFSASPKTAGQAASRRVLSALGRSGHGCDVGKEREHAAASQPPKESQRGHKRQVAF
ncbi:hypothetical protein DdX_01101 [Ditylenchus destructor]|uniref:Uncharacterized protein n=1 Tax=Ditylenchus destructor TaxID=166010 RepID=A0AAD4NEU8_9BILA|nr:hypothetical protein DdX_01101 [Ditylenchus destructor]